MGGDIVNFKRPMYWILASNVAGASSYPNVDDRSFIFIKKFDDLIDAAEYATMTMTTHLRHPLGGRFVCTRVYREVERKRGELVFCCHKGD